jgi:hypothetical protein
MGEDIMAAFNNREYNRIESLILTSYECLNENNEPFHNGMGRTLNMSKLGICLETHAPIEPKKKLSMTIMIGDELVDINGKVVYCDEGKDEMYKSGVEFLEMGYNAIKVLDSYIGSRI